MKHNIDVDTSQMLQIFLNDPVLSKLNQRPPLNGARSVAENLIHLSLDGLPQDNSDSIHRVNMWNPIVSAPKARQSSGNSHPELRNTMHQKPFRKPSYAQYPGARSSFGKTVKIVQDMRDREKFKSKLLEKKDYFHPVKKIKLSITKLNNAVSFCSAQVETKDNFPIRKNNSAKVSDSSSERFIKSANRSEFSGGHDIEINLAKGKIYENPSILRKPSSKSNRSTETSAVSGKLFADSNNTVEVHDTGDLIKASQNLKDIVKHVFFNDVKKDGTHMNETNMNNSDYSKEQTQISSDNNSDVVKHVWFSDEHNTDIETENEQTQTRNNTTVKKMFECPILEPVKQNTNSYNAHHNQFNTNDQSANNSFIFEHQSKFQNLLKETLTSQQGSKPKLNLPKPTFGLPSAKDKSGQGGTHTPKLIKGPPARATEALCSTVSLQCKHHEANWRLNQQTQNGEKEDSKENIDAIDIKASILKGSRIPFETDIAKDQALMNVDSDVPTPRSSQKSYSGKGAKRKVKKTALASGVMNSLWYPSRMM